MSNQKERRNVGRGTVTPDCVLANPFGLDIRFLKWNKSGAEIEFVHPNPDVKPYIRRAGKRVEICLDCGGKM